MRVSNIVEKPIVTEKTMVLEADNKYVFKVNARSTKSAIADEVSRLYGVDVEDVSTMIMPGKKRRVMGTRQFIKTKKWKKAVVKVKPGQKIELVGK